LRKQQRADWVRQRLGQLYPRPAIPLNHHDDFTLLVAVVLSAQCTDKKVNEITPALFEVAGTPQLMSQLGEEKILDIIRPLGLSKQKAKHLARLAQIIAVDYGGVVPSSIEALEALPGVGHKTASVVMVQAFGVPALPVDTHIHRLAQRWGLTSGKSVIQTERDLKKLFPESSWHDVQLQIIYYGREHCTARRCDGTRCLLCRELYPRRKKPVTWIKP